MNRTPSQKQQEDIREAFGVMEGIRQSFLRLDNVFGLRIALRDIEQRWGEYFVANELLEAGIGVTSVQ
ncbi:MAG: hypothetical protein HYY68_08390, partial [Thaumarchaeota archaeon]|nr:hypothetical protein [Nitrososphaerota archaeon]